MQRTQYVDLWIIRASEDIDAAEALLEAGGPWNPICFHAQQAAEKYLKAFLAFHNKNIGKIHQLDSLASDCEAIDKEFITLREDAIHLTHFYISTRYPADIPTYGKTDAKHALEAARRL